MSKISVATCVAELNRANLNRRLALQTELAVGLAVFLSTDDEPKQILREVYASSGYACLYTSDIDYKTINRRINVVAELYKFLTRAKLSRWVGKHTEADMIRALEIGLGPYEIYGVRDIERLCQSTPRAYVKAHTRGETVVNGAPDLLAGPTTGQDSVSEMFRRASDRIAEGAHRIETEHIAVTVPAEATRDEIVTLAKKLLELAEEFLLTS